MTQSPLLFLIFNRHDTTLTVFEKIRQYRPAKLYIAADGARENVWGEKEKCEDLKTKLLASVDWPCEVKTLFRTTNLGCKIAISSAIDWFFEHEEMGIILEDDCLPNPSFFVFCNTLLLQYKDDERIMQISGNNFQFGKTWGEASYYFSNYSHIWGWATWRRAWKLNSLSQELYEEFLKSNQINYLFHTSGERSFWLDHFKKVYNNKIDTWDAQWQISTWMQHGLCVLPNINLVTNIGFNASASRTKDASNKLANLKAKELDEKIRHPAHVINNYMADLNTYHKAYKFSLKARLFLGFISLKNKLFN